MAVQEQLGVCSVQVRDKRDEAQMHFVFAIMNASRRVVRDENVDHRELAHGGVHFGFVEKKVSNRLVAPRPGETSKPDIIDGYRGHVQIRDAF